MRLPLLFKLSLALERVSKVFQEIETERLNRDLKNVKDAVTIFNVQTGWAVRFNREYVSEYYDEGYSSQEEFFAFRIFKTGQYDDEAYSFISYKAPGISQKFLKKLSRSESTDELLIAKFGSREIHVRINDPTLSNSDCLHFDFQVEGKSISTFSISKRWFVDKMNSFW